MKSTRLVLEKQKQNLIKSNTLLALPASIEPLGKSGIKLSLW